MAWLAVAAVEVTYGLPYYVQLGGDDEEADLWTTTIVHALRITEKKIPT